MRASEVAGFYAISVVTANLKDGCPPSNGVVQFSLISGRLDEGVLAEQIAALGQHETPVLLNLSPARSTMANWLGAPGNVDGGSLLRWAGQDTTLALALATLPFAHGDAYVLHPSASAFVEVTAPELMPLRQGDLVLVRFR